MISIIPSVSPKGRDVFVDERVEEIKSQLEQDLTAGGIDMCRIIWNLENDAIPLSLDSKCIIIKASRSSLYRKTNAPLLIMPAVIIGTRRWVCLATDSPLRL